MFSEPAKNTFRYEQLPDPASYIRLVKISPSTESSETTPHISILTTPFNDAPHYHAVSYTWGPTTDPGTIIIGENEAEIYVRRNCINVLRQITHFKTCEYYWIDALCINQADNDEKSYQVAMMGEIFSRADRVLACVGLHDDSGSEIVARTLNYLDTFLSRIGLDTQVFIGDEDRTWTDAKGHCINAICYWFQSLPDKVALPFQRGLDAFGKREYFWRIWILQEIFLARRLSVFCGFDELKLSTLLFWWRDAKLLIPELLNEKAVKYMDEDEAPWTNGAYFLDQGGSGLGATLEGILYDVADPDKAGAERAPLYASDFLDLCEGRDCVDARDMIFGTLALVGWRQQENLKPDYGMSVFALARKAIDHFVETREFYRFLNILKLGVEDLDVRRGIAMRTENRSLPELSNESKQSGTWQNHFVEGGFELRPDGPFEPSSDTIGTKSYCRIAGPDGETCALAHPSTQLGDWLLPTTTCHGFVLRKSESDERAYTFIGRAFFHPSCQSTPDELTAFILLMDVDDLLIHVAQGVSWSGFIDEPIEKMVEALNVDIGKSEKSSVAEISFGSKAFSRQEWECVPSYLTPLVFSDWHGMMAERKQIEGTNDEDGSDNPAE